MERGDFEKKVFAILGPTAIGKTDLAIELVQKFPLEIISVDSVMVYQDMNIGTAKPSAQELLLAPHHLINLCTPDQIYSVADFYRDSLNKIEEILSRNKYPLLVGGTMMYFNALKKGLANLPSRDEKIREELALILNSEGLPALYKILQELDLSTANRLKPQDTQRIIRAIEIIKIQSAQNLDLAKNKDKDKNKETRSGLPYPLHAFGLISQDIAWQRERISKRFDLILKAGLVDELVFLKSQYSLHADLPSMRSVGYRQAWEYLEGNLSLKDLQERGVIATAQLAKRQRTWLRSFDWVKPIDPKSGDSKLNSFSLVCSEIDYHLTSQPFF